MYSRQELAEGFRELGVSPGDTLMVHASVRAVGTVAGGPDQIHLALKDALTADGTLMMYTELSGVLRRGRTRTSDRRPGARAAREAAGLRSLHRESRA